MERISRIVLACALLGLVWCVSVEAQTQLRWKFEPGQVLRQIIVQESTVSANVGGQSLGSNSTMTLENVWTVEKVNGEGIADVTQTTPRIQMKVKTPMGQFDIDTSAADDSTDLIGKQIAASLKGLTKTKVAFSISPTGEFSNVQLVGDETATAAAAAAFGLGKDGIISMVKQSIHPLPAMPVQPGGTWQSQSELNVPQMGKVLTDSTLTYAGTAEVDGKNLEQIRVDSKTSIAAKPGAAQLAQLTIKEQSDKGNMYFDKAAGRMSHAESEQNLTIQVTFAGQNFDQQVKTVRKATVQEGQ